MHSSHRRRLKSPGKRLFKFRSVFLSFTMNYLVFLCFQVKLPSVLSVNKFDLIASSDDN
jgi:hypothetical protein